MPKFLKFKCGFLAEIGRYLAGKWPIESGLPKILAKIFFMTKSKKLVILSRKVDPPPVFRLFFFFGGGVRQLYGTYPRYHLSFSCFKCSKNLLARDIESAVYVTLYKVAHSDPPLLNEKKQLFFAFR